MFIKIVDRLVTTHPPPPPKGANFGEFFLRKWGVFARKLRQCLHLPIFGLKNKNGRYSYCEFLIRIKLKWKWWKLFIIHAASSPPRITLVYMEGPFATPSENSVYKEKSPL
jgi:hypothetical protein